MVGQLENDRRREPKGTPSSTDGRVAKSVPFADRLSCTIEEACEATGLGRTKVYELIGSGQLVTWTPTFGDGAIAHRASKHEDVVIAALLVILRRKF